MSVHKDVKRITVNNILEMKLAGEKISMLTAYDYSMASILDAAGVDIILVGDSAANVMAGYETTLPITLDQMIYYAASVSRAVKRSLVVVDLPFGSYQGNPYDALNAAVRVMKETGAHAIKLEGGAEIKDSIECIVNAGIPVIGHLGLMPQSVNAYGGYGLRATGVHEAHKLNTDAQLLHELGCFAVVLEKIPAKLAKEVTDHLRIPTIGIGAGPDTDGQVLVINDLLGMTKGFKPKFVRQYLDLHAVISQAVEQYVSDVKAFSFPNEKEQY
ncbi:3-methyl-2-oxobutanoate hydroxymethyltransferase [Olivibacter sp. SDN3]|uniref:3-methyl-2-oxobutanoate hydroxymethyltransferase n=1 Tax=Olivibacter sp. SDN3 TaxID=2764720 RepID=UPI00165144CD|nr:3-methyl-2-oxobutanoate hydroxymethyltransferase [Olivibacter sp. SDN3]QNL50351.1 3-methyl-2-oxobutanoate hydroxymethyltransferase [Olivibacter sp. SDN3]